MDKATVWDHAITERYALLRHLETLTPAQWEAQSLCAAWRVRDVAGHVIGGPQLDWPAALRLFREFRRGYNGAIEHEGIRRGSVPIEQILEQFHEFAGVRKGPVVVTHLEPLIDAIVHTQDILRPLGIEHSPDPEAAAVAADRARFLAPLLGGLRHLRTMRLVATDCDWARGRGEEVHAPMLELLMICTGREPAHDRLRGGDAAGQPGPP